jgi:mRNA interferase MazF
MKNYSNTNYLPQRQDLIWINFRPSVGQEIRGRHPALVLSSSGYSEMTGLVMIMPITHASNNRLRNFFIPLHAQKLAGYINPLQTFTFSIQKRQAEFTGEICSDQDWAAALQIHQQILGID